jgi:Glutamate synthase domain 3
MLSANDYVGKGMNGGIIIIKNDADFAINDEKTILAGNTCLYGATGGESYISGSVGRRFAGRNQEPQAVLKVLAINAVSI